MWGGATHGGYSGPQSSRPAVGIERHPLTIPGVFAVFPLWQKLVGLFKQQKPASPPPAVLPPHVPDPSPSSPVTSAFDVSKCVKILQYGTNNRKLQYFLDAAAPDIACRLLSSQDAHHAKLLVEIVEKCARTFSSSDQVAALVTNVGKVYRELCQEYQNAQLRLYRKEEDAFIENVRLDIDGTRFGIPAHWEAILLSLAMLRNQLPEGYRTAFDGPGVSPTARPGPRSQARPAQSPPNDDRHRPQNAPLEQPHQDRKGLGRIELLEIDSGIDLRPNTGPGKS